MFKCRLFDYNKKMNIEYRNCRSCGIKFLPKSCNQWWCGDAKLRIGCAFLQCKKRRKEKCCYHKRPPKKDRVLKPNIYNLRKRFEVLKANNFKCSYCGISANEMRIEVDHIIPRSKGGTNELNNLTTACWKCNEGKLDW